MKQVNRALGQLPRKKESVEVDSILKEEKGIVVDTK